ncbi:MAG: 1-deoxy-D-xylulose-5-phosphate reductoisomerase [Nevskiaceae bacterium]|jgi:1-deoxy-D-xylulose-5-phosphate reductoisomerase|nr:1-deoxy-D-xylulose-5-phosphate reductoisomerase [Nevskiaceae bacterium]
MSTTGVAILGCTGSIGQSTLDVLQRHPERFHVAALLAHRNVERLVEQAKATRAPLVGIADETLAPQLQQRLRDEGLTCHVLAGSDAAETIARLPEAQCVMAAIVGAVGLRSTLAAAETGKRLLVANKEALVMAGWLVLAAARRSGARIIPIDSEHNAIFQCLPPDARLGEAPPGVRRLLLTASGGPFRDWSPEALQNATPEQACAHPVWRMGRKISVDSATLMNKGLELIEAHLLFGVPVDRIEVLIHRQSAVHSLVEYQDGSMLAQLGSPDMRTPIAHALGWPQRLPAGVQFLDLAQLGRLDFERPDVGRFACLGHAIEAARAGGDAPVVLNAANEVAVEAFLEGSLNFGGIAGVIGEVMSSSTGRHGVNSLESVREADAAARAAALRLVRGGLGT